MAEVVIDVNKLASNILHDKWNEDTDTGNYHSYCLQSFFDAKGFTQIDELCRKLVNFLENMEIIKDDEYYSVGRCKLINYWLYDKVKQILNSESPDIYDKDIRELYKAWNHYNTYGYYRVEQYKCEPESNIPAMEDIDDKKKVHEHCLNYYEICKKKDNNDECQKYKDYMQNLSLPYKNFDILFPKDQHDYSSYYSKCESYNPENILKESTYPQEVVMNLPRAEETVPNEQPLDRNNQGASEHEEERPPSSATDGVLGGDRVKGKVREDHEEVQAGESVGTGGHTFMERAEQNLVTGLEAGPIPVHPQLAEQTVDGLTSTEPPVSNPMVMPAGLSLFGIASLSTILYKFTPLRSLFNKLIHKNNSPNSNLHGIREEYIEYMLKSGGKNRDDRANYIAYHPA
ncbi:PIR protein [Plasmodium vivax]|nr:PIR protein [Plasmodium vivax]